MYRGYDNGLENSLESKVDKQNKDSPSASSRNNDESYTKAVGRGAINAAINMGDALIHATDTALALPNLAIDIAIVSAQKFGLIDEEGMLYQLRGKDFVRGIEGIKEVIKEGTPAQQTEMLTEIVLTLTGPFIAKGIAKAANNYSRIGQLKEPPLFVNKDGSNIPVNTPIKRETISRETVLNKLGEEEYLYAITEKEGLIIGPMEFLEPIEGIKRQVHPILAGHQRVYAAGEFTIINSLALSVNQDGIIITNVISQITRANNFTGHYLTHGNHLRTFVPNTFARAGINMPREVFQLWSDQSYLTFYELPPRPGISQPFFSGPTRFDMAFASSLGANAFLQQSGIIELHEKLSEDDAVELLLASSDTSPTIVEIDDEGNEVAKEIAQSNSSHPLTTPAALRDALVHGSVANYQDILTALQEPVTMQNQCLTQLTALSQLMQQKQDALQTIQKSELPAREPSGTAHTSAPSNTFYRGDKGNSFETTLSMYGYGGLFRDRPSRSEIADVHRELNSRDFGSLESHGHSSNGREGGCSIM